MIARIRPEAFNIDVLKALAASASANEELADGLAAYFGVKKVLLTPSARSGLYHLLKALPQKKIFIPAYTCWVVVEAALLARKDVVFIDIDLNDYNMKADLLERAIQPGAIILATHQFGIPCDIDRINACAQKNNCVVIEDNAAAFGSCFHGKKTGTFAGTSLVSFEYSKTLTSGCGGAILFNDESRYEQVRAMVGRSLHPAGTLSACRALAILFAQTTATQPWIFPLANRVFLKSEGLTRGFPQFHLSRVPKEYGNEYPSSCARLAVTNLKRIDEIIKANQANAAYYLKELAGLSGCALPRFPAHKSPVWMRFPVRILNGPKEDFYRKCLKDGVDLAFTFSYSCANDQYGFPNAHQAASTVLNLPIYSKLRPKDLDHIRDTIIKNIR